MKPLYHKAMEGVKLVPTAFSPANLAALGDSKIRQEHMNSIRSQAIELLKPPTVKVMIHGVPELIDLCFGSQTDLHTALQIVTDNDISMRELVKAELDKYCKDDDIDISTLERLLDSQWSVAAQKYSSRRMGIKYDARKHLLHAFEERLNLLRDWLDETNTESEPDIEKLRAIRSEILYIIEDSLSEINIAPYSAAYGIMKASLELIRAKLQNQGSGVDFTTLLRSGMLVIDHGELILNDDLNAIEEMIDAYTQGYDVVYGVKVSRQADPVLKRLSATAFYKLQHRMGVETIYNHADFRFLSRRVLEQLSHYQERNVYLRGIIPLLGFPSTTVDDVIRERTAGTSKYTVRKMFSLALDGITSFSVKPIYGIVYLGGIFVFISILIGIYVLYALISGTAEHGWASLMLSIWFVGGVVLLSIGAVGLYIGKIYKEVKRRPLYNVEEVLYDDQNK